jgi:cysteine-rich repeat protein
MRALVLPLLALVTGAWTCTPSAEGDDLCENERDDDADGLADCADPGCALLPVCGLCGNGDVDAGEVCDDGNLTDGDGCSQLCRDEGCGNGKKDDGEECDDGDLVPADGCSALCEVDRCGDRILQVELEDCEDGNREDGDGCSRRCQGEEGAAPLCGNQNFDFDPNTGQPLEECEDGNERSGDGCSSLCHFEFCGDGIIQPTLGEQCDDADPRAPPECNGCFIPR